MKDSDLANLSRLRADLEASRQAERKMRDRVEELERRKQELGKAKDVLASAVQEEFPNRRRSMALATTEVLAISDGGDLAIDVMSEGLSSFSMGSGMSGLSGISLRSAE